MTINGSNSCLLAITQVLGSSVGGHGIETEFSCIDKISNMITVLHSELQIVRLSVTATTIIFMTFSQSKYMTSTDFVNST